MASKGKTLENEIGNILLQHRHNIMSHFSQDNTKSATALCLLLRKGISLSLTGFWFHTIYNTVWVV